MHVDLPQLKPTVNTVLEKTMFKAPFNMVRVKANLGLNLINVTDIVFSKWLKEQCRVKIVAARKEINDEEDVLLIQQLFRIKMMRVVKTNRR